jgi:glycosyltransferase involved in cell wall biosynthesis
VNVHFFQPPAAQRIGGLDAAIQCLRSALIGHGVEIDGNLPPAGAPGHIVHFHGLWQPAHARLARECIARGLPYVVSPHGMLEPWAWRHKWWKKWPYFHLVEKRLLTRAAALLATGPKEARRLHRFAPRQRIEAIPLGLTGDARPNYSAARQHLNWAPEENVLLFLSRLHVKKGPDLLLRALGSMHWPAVTRLVIVGDGERDFAESLKRFAADHAGSLPRIDWMGAIWGDARWPYFQGADLFCLPTHSENFGLAVLEASQVGTRTLTTEDTPWAEDLRDGRGYITAPRISELRNSLARYFAAPRQTPAQRLALSDWAWRRFAWDTLAPEYSRFFQSIASAGPEETPP